MSDISDSVLDWALDKLAASGRARPRLVGTAGLRGSALDGMPRKIRPIQAVDFAGARRRQGRAVCWRRPSR